MSDPYIPKVGDIVKYTHQASGIINRNGTVMREDDEWFYIAIPGYPIEFLAHKDNRFGMIARSLMNKELLCRI